MIYNNTLMGGAQCPTHTHPHPHDTIRFDPKHIEHIIWMDDFYKATGLMGLSEQGLIKDVRQIWMNESQCNEINELCKKNARKSKKYKHLSDHHLETSVAMDWLCYSPVAVPYVPENEIWIWSADNYENAMEEYRLWRRENPREEI